MDVYNRPDEKIDSNTKQMGVEIRYQSICR